MSFCLYTIVAWLFSSGFAKLDLLFSSLMSEKRRCQCCPLSSYPLPHKNKAARFHICVANRQDWRRAPNTESMWKTTSSFGTLHSTLRKNALSQLSCRDSVPSSTGDLPEHFHLVIQLFRNSWRSLSEAWTFPITHDESAKAPSLNTGHRINLSTARGQEEKKLGAAHFLHEVTNQGGIIDQDFHPLRCLGTNIWPSFYICFILWGALFVLNVLVFSHDSILLKPSDQQTEATPTLPTSNPPMRLWWCARVGAKMFPSTEWNETSRVWKVVEKRLRKHRGSSQTVHWLHQWAPTSLSRWLCIQVGGAIVTAHTCFTNTCLRLVSRSEPCELRFCF